MLLQISIRPQNYNESRNHKLTERYTQFTSRNVFQTEECNILIFHL